MGIHLPLKNPFTWDEKVTRYLDNSTRSTETPMFGTNRETNIDQLAKILHKDIATFDITTTQSPPTTTLFNAVETSMVTEDPFAAPINATFTDATRYQFLNTTTDNSIIDTTLETITKLMETDPTEPPFFTSSTSEVTTKLIENMAAGSDQPFFPTTTELSTKTEKVLFDLNTALDINSVDLPFWKAPENSTESANLQEVLNMVTESTIDPSIFEPISLMRPYGESVNAGRIMDSVSSESPLFSTKSTTESPININMNINSILNTTLDDIFGSTTEKISAISSEFANFNLTDTIASMASEIASTPSGNTTITSEITTAASEITTVASEITTVASEITTAASEIITAVPEITTVASEITTVASEITTATSEITAAASEITTAVSEITTAAASEITTTVSKIASASSEIPSASSHMSSVSSESYDFTSEAYNAISRATQEVVTTVSDKITEAASEITTAASEITTVPSEITSAVTNVTSVSESATTMGYSSNITTEISKNITNFAQGVFQGEDLSSDSPVTNSWVFYVIVGVTIAVLLLVVGGSIIFYKRIKKSGKGSGYQVSQMKEYSSSSGSSENDVINAKV